MPWAQCMELENMFAFLFCFQERSALLRKFYQLIMNNTDELAKIITAEHVRHFLISKKAPPISYWFHSWRNKQTLISFYKYSRLSLSRIPRVSFKHFEISVPWHIRVAELRKTVDRTTTFNKWICNLPPEDTDVLKYCGKEEELLLRSNFSSFPQYFVLLLDFYVKTETTFSLREKRLFEISEVEITRVNCRKMSSVYSLQITFLVETLQCLCYLFHLLRLHFPINGNLWRSSPFYLPVHNVT